jgi:hypothetical protein
MKQLIAVVLLLLSFAACNNSTAPSTSDISAKPNRDTLIHNIEVLEQQINTQQTVDYNFAAELVAAYLNFFNNYPKDDMAADYLFKAGDVSMNIKGHDQSKRNIYAGDRTIPQHKDCRRFQSINCQLRQKR